MLNLLVMAATWRSPPSTDYLSNPFWVGYNGMPPIRRHPQIPSSTQTGTPNFDTFLSPLFMVVTFKQTTIKHSMFMPKVPFLCTERACVFFFSFRYYTGPVNSADSTDFTGPDKTHSLVLKHTT